jgi:DnaJ-class molecular chaperone
MGMDISGKKPRTEVGEYVRFNVWHWRPLWTFCEFLAPALTDLVQYGHSNDGDGLDDERSVELGRLLETALSNGVAVNYTEERDAKLTSMPDEACDICKGTGRREDAVLIGPCNGCSGSGQVRPWATWYRLAPEDITEFAAFLKDCGGFEIW